jgi:hypothetical protein
MALTGLCTSDDVLKRLANPALAVADTDEGVIAEAVDRKIDIAHEKLELTLISRVQQAIAPYQKYNDLTPAAIVALLTTESKLLMKTCAVEWVLYYLFEEGESTLRFKYDEAQTAISQKMDRLRREKDAALDIVWPLITFNIDGSSTVSDLERMLTNRVRSISVSM